MFQPTWALHSSDWLSSQVCSISHPLSENPHQGYMVDLKIVVSILGPS